MSSHAWRSQVLLALSFLLLPVSALHAHPPYVAPYKHVLTYSLAGLLGILCYLFLPKKWYLEVKVAIGVVVALLSWFIGTMISPTFAEDRDFGAGADYFASECRGFL
jgi:hypothetical protein